MKLTVLYSFASLHETAKFIWDHNMWVSQWPDRPKNEFDIIEIIHKEMMRSCRKNAQVILLETNGNPELSENWQTYTGTGGYYFLFELIDHTPDEIKIGVDVLVDASVSHPCKGYTSESVDIKV